MWRSRVQALRHAQESYLRAVQLMDDAERRFLDLLSNGRDRDEAWTVSGIPLADWRLENARQQLELTRLGLMAANI